MSRTRIECNEPSDYVYLIYDPAGYVKIGIAEADRLEKRIREIQTGNPRPLVFIDAFWQESRGRAQWQEERLHKLFGQGRQMGEWFEAGPVICWYDWICTQRSFFIGNVETVHTDEFFKLSKLPMPTDEPIETFVQAWKKGERESILRRRGLVSDAEWKEWIENNDKIKQRRIIPPAGSGNA